MTSKQTHTQVDCLGYPVFGATLDQLPEKSKLSINTINQYSYCIAEKDSGFKRALMESDVLLPDGISMVITAKLLHGKSIKKIAGADIHQFFLEKLNQEKGSCFYLGSSQTTLDKITKKIAIDFPNVRIASFSPPFKPEFSNADNAEMIAKVNSFNPDVLFVGMTAPKQEKWSFAHVEQLNARVVCSIGAVFDFYAGTVERPNERWQNLGLEWLGRFLKEPRRMWQRYLRYGGVFVYYLLREKFRRVTGLAKTAETPEDVKTSSDTLA